MVKKQSKIEPQRKKESEPWGCGKLGHVKKDCGLKTTSSEVSNDGGYSHGDTVDNDLADEDALPASEKNENRSQ